MKQFIRTKKDLQNSLRKGFPDMLNLLHLTIIEKTKWFLIIILLGFAVFFLIKTCLTGQKEKKLEDAKEKIQAGRAIYAELNPDKGKTVKYSVFNNSILIELNAGVVDNFELFSGRLTDFAIEKRIDAYRIDKELTDAEISKAFEEILTKETEEAAQKG